MINNNHSWMSIYHQRSIASQIDLKNIPIKDFDINPKRSSYFELIAQQNFSITNNVHAINLSIIDCQIDFDKYQYLLNVYGATAFDNIVIYYYKDALLFFEGVRLSSVIIKHESEFNLDMTTCTFAYNKSSVIDISKSKRKIITTL